MSALTVFPRFFKPCVGVAGLNAAEQAAMATGIATPLQVVNFAGNGLTIAWNVHRTRSSAADIAEVTITNLPLLTRKWLDTTWRLMRGTPPVIGAPGFRCGLFLGWDSMLSLVFAGEVYDLVAERRANGGTDIETIIRMGDGYARADANAKAPTVHSYGAGQTTIVWGLLLYCFSQINLQVDPSQQPIVEAAVAATPLPVDGQISLEGDVAAVVESLVASIGLEWKVHDGLVIFLKSGITVTAQGSTALLLSASTGLLDWEPTDGGAKAIAFAHPDVRVGTQFTIIDSFGVPAGPGYRVEAVEFSGNSKETSTMVLDGKVSSPI